ncbi:TetR/AcrR family transcriptional regulator [Flocculibacter collagenilyticus]|uniref:TetR/AcrR family transcriptional regulator n=1 Tax=Flocculibacter collagenilyticus TaxID=2744479 RepID=UPI0018F5A9CF|nr:TetR/AcrR family transcriptional regulator [Flocculibacter collagenilyticus]
MNQSKGEQTRQHLIEVGAHLFHLQGYSSTGLQQILKEAGVAKGSFYFHFNDKEAFALAIIDYFAGVFKQRVAQHLLNPELSAEQKLDAFNHYTVTAFTEMNFKAGCPIGNFCQELADSSESVAIKVGASLNGMARCFAGVIEQGKQENVFSNDLDAEDCANFIVDSWEGAVLRMKAQRSAEPLHNWLSFIKRLLKPS